MAQNNNHILLSFFIHLLLLLAFQVWTHPDLLTPSLPVEMDPQSSYYPLNWEENWGHLIPLYGSTQKNNKYERFCFPNLHLNCFLLFLLENKLCMLCLQPDFCHCCSHSLSLSVWWLLITLSLFELQFKSSQIENYFQYCFHVLVWAFPFGGPQPPPPLIIMLKRENGRNFHHFPWKKSFLSQLVCSRSRIVMPTWVCKSNWALRHTSDASPWCLDSRKPEGFHLMPGLLWMAKENGISNVDNDAQVQALIYTGPQGKHHTVWPTESDAHECGIMFLW